MGIGKTERNTVQRGADLGIFRELMTSVKRNAANLFSGNLAEHANHAVSDRLRGFVRGLNGQQNLYQATVQGAIDRSATDLNRVFLELQSVLNLLRQPLFAELFLNKLPAFVVGQYRLAATVFSVPFIAVLRHRGRYFRCPLFPRFSSRLIVDGDRPNSLAMVRILFP